MKHRCELRFRLHWAFTYASLSRVPLYVSWAFLVLKCHRNQIGCFAILPLSICGLPNRALLVLLAFSAHPSVLKIYSSKIFTDQDNWALPQSSDHVKYAMYRR